MALPIINGWINTENISQLTVLFSAIKLFFGNYERQISVLRCEICFRYQTKDSYYLQSVKDAFSTVKKKGGGVGR